MYRKFSGNDIKNLFSNITENYELFNQIASLGLVNLWRKKLVKVLMDLYKVDGNILDLGCGDGMLSRELLGVSKNVTGIDFVFQMLKNAKNLGLPNLKLACADVVDLPFKSSSFMFVTSSFVLRNLFHFFPDVCRELDRVVNKNGRCIFLDLTTPKNNFFSFLHFIYLNIFVRLIGLILFKKFYIVNHLIKTVRNLNFNFFKMEMKKVNFFLEKEIVLNNGIVSLWVYKKI